MCHSDLDLLCVNKLYLESKPDCSQMLVTLGGLSNEDLSS